MRVLVLKIWISSPMNLEVADINKQNSCTVCSGMHLSISKNRVLNGTSFPVNSKL